MTRIVQEIPDGACIVDCVTRVTSRAVADRMRADGVDGVYQYIGKMSLADPGLLHAHVDNILAAGMGFLGVCFADQFDGARRAALFRAAGALDGLTLTADLESYHLSAASCSASLNAFALDVETAGFLPALYVGAGQPLDAFGLGQLRFARYHKSLSQVPMPVYQGQQRGWSMVQHFGDPRDPSVDWRHVMRGGVNVDLNTAGPDALGRRLTWMVDDGA